MELTRLKYNQIKEHREKTLQAQEGLCGLCKEPLSPEEAVCDHSHATGRIRQVLHRGCNALLGKIENSMSINRITDSRLRAIAANLVTYIETSETDILHPTHKTPGEKKERSKKLAKLARARRLKDK